MYSAEQSTWSRTVGGPRRRTWRVQTEGREGDCAHGPVRNYQDQHDAQRHYAQIAKVRQGEEKYLPKDFPWDAAQDAAQRCRLTGVPEPEPDTQGPCPSTTMPHLMRSLGLL